MPLKTLCVRIKHSSVTLTSMKQITDKCDEAAETGSWQHAVRTGMFLKCFKIRSWTVRYIQNNTRSVSKSLFQLFDSRWIPLWCRSSCRYEHDHNDVTVRMKEPETEYHVYRKWKLFPAFSDLPPLDALTHSPVDTFMCASSSDTVMTMMTMMMMMMMAVTSVVGVFQKLAAPVQRLQMVRKQSLINL